MLITLRAFWLFFSPTWSCDSLFWELRTGAAAVGAAPGLDLEEVNVWLDEVAMTEKYVKQEGDAIKLMHPERAVEDESRKAVVCQT